MSGTGPVAVGFIGAGMMSDTYLENLTSVPDVRVVIVGARYQRRAREQAAKYKEAERGSITTCSPIPRSRSS